MELQNDQILVRLVTTNRLSYCPYCKQPSNHLHSHYSHTLADLPCADFKLTLLLKVRRFRCQNAACSHRTFAEPVGELATRYARRTLRQLARLRSIGLALGGEAGARLAQGVG